VVEEKIKFTNIKFTNIYLDPKIVSFMHNKYFRYTQIKATQFNPRDLKANNKEDYHTIHGIIIC